MSREIASGADNCGYMLRDPPETDGTFRIWISHEISRNQQLAAYGTQVELEK